MGKAVKPLTKSQIVSELAEKSGLSKKDVTAGLEAMSGLVSAAVSKKGPGQFTIPNLCKIVVKVKPATKKRQVRNPQTGEMKWADPKPASRVVRVRPLKALKDMVA